MSFASPTGPCLIDVNAGFVVEDPRDLSSVYDLFFSRAPAIAEPVPPILPPLGPEITRKDFADHISIAQHSPHALATRGHASSPTDNADPYLTVPSQYFDPDFSLRESDTLSYIISSGPLHETQERLVTYLDAVECKLLTSINARTNQFFDTLVNLQTLRDLVAAAKSASAKLAQQVTQLKEESALAPLYVIAAIRRLHRKMQVLKIEQSLHGARQATQRIGHLVEGGDLLGALEIAQKTRMFIRNNLAGVTTAAGLERQILDYEHIIGNSLISSYVQGAIRLVTVGPVVGDGQAEGPAPTDAHVLEICPIVEALLRLQQMENALQAFQTAFIRELRALVREELTEGVTTFGPAEKVAAMSPDMFLSSFSSITRTLLEVLQRFLCLHSLLERTFDVHRYDDTRVTGPVSTIRSLRAMASGMVAAAVETAHRHVARVLAQRRDQSARMRLQHLRELHDVCVIFMQTSSASLVHATANCSAFGSPLTAECLLQARLMLKFQHSHNQSAISALLDAEPWRQAEIPKPIQDLVNALHLCSDVENAAPVSRTLKIRGNEYHMVSTGIMLINMIGYYAEIADTIPEVAPEVITATVELLRIYNVKSSHAVLGAGAIHSAGLKRITAKHLALSAQTLGALLALLPSIRASVVMRIPTSQLELLTEFTSVTSEFMQHEQRILSKLVAIMKDLLIKCCTDMKSVPWADPNEDVILPTTPMKELINGITMLHRIVAPLLPSDQLQDVVIQTVTMVAAQLPLQYTALLTYLSDQALQIGTARCQSSTTATTTRNANERLLVDVKSLVKELEDILNQCNTLPDGQNTSGSIAATATAALRSLTTWATRQFSGDITVCDASLLEEGPS